MGRRGRRRGRSLDGILLLDKPVGRSSNQALQEVKRLYGARKAGHTGSLDPLASGMLPVCFGQATKMSAFLLEAGKSYRVTARFGIRTSTGDADGEVLESSATGMPDATAIRSALDDFRGEIQQVPPMYSAVRHKGERLYKLAREGREVERAPRPVTIYEISLETVDGDCADFQVRCSKGTYVRTLVEDIASTLGTYAHVVALRRTSVGPYEAGELVTMEALQALAGNSDLAAMDALLLDVDSAVLDRPGLQLSRDSAFYLSRGQPVSVPRAPSCGQVRLYAENELFLGVGEILDDGRVAPRRLFTA